MEWCAAANTYRCMRGGRSRERVRTQGGRVRTPPRVENMVRKAHGRHDMVRIVDRHIKALIWSRKCSGYARCRMGPQLMNRCKPEKLVTKDHWKMLRTSSNSKKERYETGGEKGRVTRKECKRLREEFELEVPWRKKGSREHFPNQDVGKHRSSG